MWWAPILTQLLSLWLEVSSPTNIFTHWVGNLCINHFSFQNNKLSGIILKYIDQYCHIFSLLWGTKIKFVSYCFLCFSGRPVVTIPSSNYNVVIGNSITLPCTISASPSVTATSWLFTSNSNTQIQITASNVKYTVSSAGGFYNLTVNSATSSDAGVYECRATNAIDTSTDSARLDVSGSEFLQTSSHPPTPWNILSIFIQYIPQLHNTTNMRFFVFFSL